MTEKRYVVKSGDLYWSMGGCWQNQIDAARMFAGPSYIIQYRNWASDSITPPVIIEVERVSEPWREVREL